MPNTIYTTRLGGPPSASASWTIAAGDNISTAIDLGECRAAKIVIPAAWTAAGLSFLVSRDGVTYYPDYSDLGAAKTLPIVAGAAHDYPGLWARGARYLKLVSSVAQAAQRDGEVWGEP